MSNGTRSDRHVGLALRFLARFLLSCGPAYRISASILCQPVRNTEVNGAFSTALRQQSNQQRYVRLKEWREDNQKLLSGISRHCTGEKRISLVVMFDNVDKWSRDVQFGMVQGTARALVIVNLRDTAFEAHREEPPARRFHQRRQFLHSVGALRAHDPEAP